MKAFALTAADKPAALVDLPDPVAPAGGVLIRVRAASVNGFDIFEANGHLVSTMPHHFPVVVGRDFAGVVIAVGEGRTDVAVGDDVLGFLPATPPLHVGTWAELVAGGPDIALTPKPAGMSFEVAAAMPLAGVTAHDIVHAVDITQGDTVVVIGATGGVGSFVVQLAAHHGATVIATARAGEADEHVRALGATETLDYSVGDVADTLRTRFPDGIDILIDLVSRDAAFVATSSLVRRGGRIATTVGAADVAALAARGIRATNVMGSPTRDKLAELVAHVDEGSIRVEIQETYPLEDAAAAIAAFAAGTVSKIVLRVG